MIALVAAAFGLVAKAQAQTILEDAEDGLTTGWSIYDSTPAGASISNVSDSGSRAISFAGSGTSNGYVLGGTNSSNGFNIQDSTTLSWRMRAAESYVVYIAMDTTDGFRYLTYSDSNNLTPSGSSTYVNVGLGNSTVNDSWITITRNLLSDLQIAQPGNNIIAVNGVLIRGSISVDDIMTLSDPSDGNQAPVAVAGANQSISLGATVTLDGAASSDADGTIALYQWQDSSGSVIGTSSSSPTAQWQPASVGTFVVTLTVTDNVGGTDSDTTAITVTDPSNPDSTTTLLEDAEDGLTTGWNIYDSTPAGATISNVSDGGSRVISFNGGGTANGYYIGGTNSSNGFNIQNANSISWRMRTAESYVVYIAVESSSGLRYLTYSDSSNLIPSGNSTYVNVGLGNGTVNDSWITITRNLASDLQTAQPGNDLIAINGVLIRGSISIDDIMTMDDQGSSNPDDPNQLPVANAGNDQIVELGNTVTLTGSNSTDSDGTLTLYEWRDVNGDLINAASPSNPDVQWQLSQ